MVEIAVGCVLGWLFRKVRRVGEQADAEVDRSLDVGMSRVHELVSRKLGEEPALLRAEEERDAGRDSPSSRTRQRLELALEDAVEHDAEFARALREILDDLPGAAEVTSDRVHNEISGGTFFGRVVQTGTYRSPESG